MSAPDPIRVALARGAPDLGAAWPELVRRAAPNVFLDPAALAVVAETGFAEIVTLVARAGDTLLGVWALELKKTTPLGPTILSAPVHEYAYVSSPVLDPARAGDVMAAFFRAIADDASLPRVVRLRHLDGEYESFRALAGAPAVRRRLTLSVRERAFATRARGIKKSGATRKKLRQLWHRLAAEGIVTLDNHRDPRIALAAFDAFLAMERKGWKGAAGTALLSRQRHAHFVRRMFAALALAGNASVACLRLDGRAIATQVLFYCGTTAYTWKTAYDQSFERVSPGMLLIDRLSEELLAGDIEAIESCSPDGSFMTSLWEGRRQTVDTIVDLGRRPSPAFALVAIGVHAYAAAKGLRNRLRDAAARRPRGRAAPA